MRFERYATAEAFGADVLDILLENEARNNSQISSILREADKSDWLFATVKDGAGSVVLTAVCSPPRNIILCAADSRPCDTALKALSDELKALGFTFPGVLAEQELAMRFAGLWANGYRVKLTTNVMRLDTVNDFGPSPGFSRPLRESDVFFVPYWERAFAEDCHLDVSDIMACAEHCGEWLVSGRPVFIWEDGNPVSMAANHRDTQNGAGIGYVYTPPHFRGKGYASSVVADVSRDALARGFQFCFLFADAANPTSCGIYRKIGFRDLCVYSDIKFEQNR
jgi:hypothetical protein